MLRAVIDGSFSYNFHSFQHTEERTTRHAWKALRVRLGAGCPGAPAANGFERDREMGSLPAAEVLLAA
jgi:hypothetical protein